MPPSVRSPKLLTGLLRRRRVAEKTGVQREDELVVRRPPAVDLIALNLHGHGQRRVVIVRLGLDQAQREIDDAVTNVFLKRIGAAVTDRKAAK